VATETTSSRTAGKGSVLRQGSERGGTSLKPEGFEPPKTNPATRAGSACRNEVRLQDGFGPAAADQTDQAEAGQQHRIAFGFRHRTDDAVQHVDRHRALAAR
jgi:hypothetical protein